MATSKPLKSCSKAELEEEMIMRNLQVSNLTKQQMMDAIVQYDTDSNTEINKRLEMESGMKTPESQMGRMNIEKKDKGQTCSTKASKNLSRNEEARVLELRYQMEIQKLQIAVDEERKRFSEIEDEKRRRECEADRLFRAEQAEKDRELKLQLSRIEMEMEIEKQKMESQARIEMEKQKLEREKLAFQDREKDRNFQLNMKKAEMKNLSGNSDDDEGHAHYRGSADYKVLPNQRQNENVLEYFTLFEKTATLHNIEEDRWHLSIGTKFNEATRQVFQRLSIEEMQSYETIKAELLKHFKLSSLTLYTNFRNYEKDPKDTFNQFGNRLTEAFDLYLESKKIKEFDALHDDVILQQFCENLKGNLRRYVMDKDPKTLAEASGLCDHYVSNISGSPGRTRNQYNNSWKEQRLDAVQFNHYGYYDRSPNKFRNSYRRPHYNYRGYDTSCSQFGSQQRGSIFIIQSAKSTPGRVWSRLHSNG